jgi:hypothetical protein
LEVEMLGKKTILLLLSIMMFSSSVFADGFSLTLDVPIQPRFSIGLGINYSLQVISNLYVGISSDLSFIASNPDNAKIALNVRFGGKYIAALIDEPAYYLKYYAGVGLEITAFANSNVSSDINGGFFTRFFVSKVAKIYGGIDGALTFGFGSINSGLNLEASLFAGIKIDPSPAFSAYFQFAGGWNRIQTTGARDAGYLLDARIGAYFAIVPQFRLGLYIGFQNGQTRGGEIVFGVGGQFLEKPGSLATPGNYLP